MTVKIQPLSINNDVSGIKIFAGFTEALLVSIVIASTVDITIAEKWWWFSRNSC